MSVELAIQLLIALLNHAGDIAKVVQDVKASGATHLTPAQTAVFTAALSGTHDSVVEAMQKAG